MPVACCCDQTIFAEQIKFHNMGTLESRVRPVFICFFVAVFLMLLGIFPVNGEQIDSFIGSIVEPGEMVDTQYIDLNILTFTSLSPMVSSRIPFNTFWVPNTSWQHPKL